MDGFIKIYRKFTEWEWYQDTNTKVVFLHLLLKASFKDSKFQGEIVKKGEVVTSISRLSNELNISQQAVRTAIKHLEKTEEINKRSTSKLTIITIRKYGIYQGLDETNQQANQQANNNQLTSDQQTTNKQLTTLEECKEIKKVRNKEIYNPPTPFWGDERFRKAFQDFCAMRTKMKSPMTDRAKTMLINKLNELSGDMDTQIRVLDQSMLNGWQSVYTLSPSKPKGQVRELE